MITLWSENILCKCNVFCLIGLSLSLQRGINWEGKIHPGCNRIYPIRWGDRLNNKDKGDSQMTTILSLFQVIIKDHALLLQALPSQYRLFVFLSINYFAMCSFFMCYLSVMRKVNKNLLVFLLTEICLIERHYCISCQVFHVIWNHCALQSHWCTEYSGWMSFFLNVC